MTYNQMKEFVRTYDIKPDEQNINREINQGILKPFLDGSHHIVLVKNKEHHHSLQKFTKILKEFTGEKAAPDAAIELIWRYCPDCQKLWSKYLVGYHNGENLAYARDFVDKGEVVGL